MTERETNPAAVADLKSDPQSSASESRKELEGIPGRWRLDQASLAGLIETLGTSAAPSAPGIPGTLTPDLEEGSKKYIALRKRLSRFFEWNRAETPEELADETLDRLARRVAQTASLTANLNASPNANSGHGSGSGSPVLHPEEFASGIARLVLQEHWRQKLRTEQALETVKRDFELVQSSDRLAHARAEEARRSEELTGLLDEGLMRLSPDQRGLIRRYYSAEGRAQTSQGRTHPNQPNQIDARKQLADELGISINALRNRALRIRADLECWARRRMDSLD